MAIWHANIGSFGVQLSVLLKGPWGGPWGVLPLRLTHMKEHQVYRGFLQTNDKTTHHIP